MILLAFASEVLSESSAVNVTIAVVVGALGVAFGAGVTFMTMRARQDRIEAEQTRHHAEDEEAHAKMETGITRDVAMLSARIGSDTATMHARIAEEGRRADASIARIADKTHDTRTMVTDALARLYVLEDRLGVERGQLTPRPQMPPRRPG